MYYIFFRLGFFGSTIIVFLGGFFTSSFGIGSLFSYCSAKIYVIAERRPKRHKKVAKSLAATRIGQPARRIDDERRKHGRKIIRIFSTARRNIINL